MILELSCDCYWNLNMTREYLRKQFELILVRGTGMLSNNIQFDKIEKSTFLLEDILTMEFDKFFRIDSFIIKESSIYAKFTSNFILVH